MSCCGGLNQFLTPTVPSSNIDGPPLDVSGLTAGKTIYLSGEYIGRYVILGSHDGTLYVPVASFEGGAGPQTIRRDINATLASIKIRRSANKSVVINVAGQSTCACSSS